MGKISRCNPDSPIDVSAYDWSVLFPGFVTCPGAPELLVVGQRALPPGPEPVVVRPPASPAKVVDALIQKIPPPKPAAPAVAFPVANLPGPVNVGQKFFGHQPPAVRGPVTWSKGRDLETGGWEWTLVHAPSVEYLDQMPKEQEATSRPYDPANRLTYPVSVSTNALAPDPTLASMAEGEVIKEATPREPLTNRMMSWCEKNPYLCWGVLGAAFYMVGGLFRRRR